MVDLPGFVHMALTQHPLNTLLDPSLIECHLSVNSSKFSLGFIRVARECLKKSASLSDFNVMSLFTVLGSYREGVDIIWTSIPGQKWSSVLEQQPKITDFCSIPRLRLAGTVGFDHTAVQGNICITESETLRLIFTRISHNPCRLPVF